MTSEWTDVLPAKELGPGVVLEYSHGGVDLLLFRTASGALRAMEAYCPHLRNYIPNGLPPGRQLGDLLQDEELVCPFHKWRFDGLGHCSGIPDGQRVPARVANGERIVRTCQLREADGVIQIGELEPAMASEP